MTNLKVTELGALTVPDTADLIHIIDDVAGTPINKKVTVSNLLIVKSVKDFGAVGDNVADDTNAIKAALTALNLGGLLLFPPGTYLVTDTLTMSANTTIDLGGATLSFNFTGKFRLLVTANFCTVRNGTVQNVTTDVVTHGAEFQQPICIGFSNSITTTSPDTVHDVICENLTITSTSPEGNGIFVFGASYNILVQNIDFPDSTALGEPIGGHWSVEPGGDETQGTGHPNNITYRNIRLGSMSSTGTAAVFLSACRAVTLENIFVGDFQAGSIVRVFAGDHGFTYALDTLAQDEGTTLKARNVNGKALIGVTVDMRDTLEAVEVWPSSIDFETCAMQSRSTATATSTGLIVGGVDGISVKDCRFDLFFNGIFLNTEVTDFLVENNKFTNTNKNSVDADNSASCKNIRFIGNRFDASNTATGTGYDMIFGSFIDGILLQGNIFNSPAVTFNVNAVSTARPTNMRVINNHVEASGGTNFVFGTSTSRDICVLFDGNTQAETVTNNIRGGQEYVPYAISGYVNSLPIKYYTGEGTPAVGTYNQGDETSENLPTAGGKRGSVCVTSGSEGTYAEGRTATTDGTTTIVLSASSDVLRKGDYLTINATDIRVESLTGTTLISDVTVASGSGLAITYNAGTWDLFGVIDGNQEIVITTNVITAAENGRTFFLNLVGGFTSTLPTPAIGLKYTFIVTTAPTTAYIITTNAGANLLFGTFLDIVGELTYFSAQDTLNFVASTSLVGDSLIVESDGTNWYCMAKSGADGGITVAVT